MSSTEKTRNGGERRPYSPPKLVRYGGLSQPVLGNLVGPMADGSIVVGKEGKT